MERVGGGPWTRSSMCMTGTPESPCPANVGGLGLFVSARRCCSWCQADHQILGEMWIEARFGSGHVTAKKQSRAVSGACMLENHRASRNEWTDMVSALCRRQTSHTSRQGERGFVGTEPAYRSRNSMSADHQTTPHGVSRLGHTTLHIPDTWARTPPARCGCGHLAVSTSQTLMHHLHVMTQTARQSWTSQYQWGGRTSPRGMSIPSATVCGRCASTSGSPSNQHTRLDGNGLSLTLD